MIGAIDTNILLDILIPKSEYQKRSWQILEEANYRGALIISEIVYAELSSQFNNQEELNSFLKEANIELKYSSRNALFMASSAWKKYTTRKRAELLCSRCGEKIEIKCKKCGQILTIRQHILADFLIGAHAYEQADCLLTRDRGYYHRYFKELKIIEP